MGIVSFSHCFSSTPTLSTLLTPLQALIGLFRPTPPVSGEEVAAAPQMSLPRHLTASPGLHRCASDKNRTPAASHAKPPLTASPRASRNQLKIVRQFEPGASASCAGRMTISGSMADVCAALDRMAQH